MVEQRHSTKLRSRELGVTTHRLSSTDKYTQKIALKRIVLRIISSARADSVASSGGCTPKTPQNARVCAMMRTVLKVGPCKSFTSLRSWLRNKSQTDN